MRSESTRAARSSQQLAAVRVRERIIGEPALTPLMPKPFEPDPAAGEQFLVDCAWVLANGAQTMVLS